MNHYVTSILMAAIGNSCIPLSLAFSPGETKVLYNLHFKAFKNQFGIDLSTYIIESDQGPVIEGICNEKNIVHIYFLRHFLHSLKFNEFSFAAGQILKSVSNTDCNQAKSVLIEEYQNLEEEKLKKLNKTLNKIGLQLENNTIIEVNTDLWNRCSMNHRCDYGMPSTTNSLEATHGHLNKKTPRKNDFWSSINRLASSLTITEESFNKKIRHNFNHAKRKTMEICKKLDKKKTIENQKEFYNTTRSQCFCSENKLTSMLLKTDIP